MMNVELFALTQKALKEEVNTLTSLSLHYGDNRRKEGRDFLGRLSGSESSTWVVLCIGKGSICGLVQRKCGAALMLPPLSHRHSLLPLGDCQLTVP